MAKKKDSAGNVAASSFGVITIIIYIAVLLFSPLVLLFHPPPGMGEMFSYAYFFAVSIVFGFLSWFLMVRKGVPGEHNALLSVISGFFISYFLLYGLLGSIISIV